MRLVIAVALATGAAVRLTDWALGPPLDIEASVTQWLIANGAALLCFWVWTDVARPLAKSWLGR